MMTSDKHTSGTERVAEVASQPRFQGYTTIVNVQGDEPFIGIVARSPENIVVNLDEETSPNPR